MVTVTDLNDELVGDKVVCEARQVAGPKIINKSGRHKSQRVTLKDNVKCIIVKRARFVSRNP